MTLTAGSYILDYYLAINFNIEDRSLGYNLMLLSILSISVSLPNFVHKLFSINRKYILISFISVSALGLGAILLSLSKGIQSYTIIGVMLIIIISTIYSYVVSFIKILKIEDKDKKRAGVVFLGIFLILFIALLFLDINMSSSYSVLIFPLFYIIFGFYITYLSIKYLEINKAVSRNYKSKFNLTEREAQIASLVIDGNTYKAIGEILFISVNTVRTHVKHIYEKTGTNSKIELRKKLEAL